MSAKLKVLGAGAIFFLASQSLVAQVKKSDSIKTKELETVVLLGVTKKKASEAVGNSVQLSSKDVNSPAIVSVDQALQGKTPGVVVNTSSGTPGSQQTVMVRGMGSISSSNDPLYVIDGVPVENGDVGPSVTGSTISTLASINSQDIESITVLKDASATALYGARGSNGVIVITTKNGKKGKTKFNLSSAVGFQNDAYFKRRFLTGEQRFDLLKVAVSNAFGVPVENAGDVILENELAGANLWVNRGRVSTNWYDTLTNKNASLYNVDFSASGGDDKGTFYASLGYNRTEPTIKVANPFQRIAGLLKVTRKLTDRINFEGSVNGSWVSQNPINEQSSYLSNPYLTRALASPWANPYNEDGSINIDTFIKYGGAQNYLYFKENDVKRQTLLRGLVNAKIDYKILKDLVFATRVNLDYTSLIYKGYDNRTYGQTASQGGNGEQAITNAYAWVVQNSLTYKFGFGSHNFNVLAMHEYQKYQQYGLSGSGQGFSADGLTNLASTSKNKNTNSTYSDYANLSYLGMLTYNYANRLILDGSIRREGSSKFAPSNRFGTFWSVGGAYNLHKDVLSDIFNELKLRASYGVTGNSNITSNVYQRLLSYTSNYDDNGAINPSSLGNEKLTWEKNKTFDAGINFALLNRRLSGSVAYYNKYTYDLLLDAPLSRTTGFESQPMNVGAITNRGIEALLSYDIFRNENFTWNISANIATVRNRVNDLVRDTEGNIISPLSGDALDQKNVEIGKDFGFWYMPTWAGVNVQTGAPEWYKNGVDGERTSNYAEAQRTYQGSAIPKYTGGVSTHIEYKGLFLDASVYFSGGNKVYEDIARLYMRTNDFTLARFNGSDELLNAWRQPGDVTNVPKLVFGETNNFDQESSRHLYDGTFARLRDVTLGYNLPSKFLSEIGIEGVTFTVKATNIYTWVKDKNLKLDPETSNNNIMNTGVIRLTAPPVKSIIFGVNLKF